MKYYVFEAGNICYHTAIVDDDLNFYRMRDKKEIYTLDKYGLLNFVRQVSQGKTSDYHCINMKTSKVIMLSELVKNKYKINFTDEDTLYEIDTLRRMGHTEAQIAEQFDTSPKTLQRHYPRCKSTAIDSLGRKLGNHDFG